MATPLAPDNVPARIIRARIDFIDEAAAKADDRLLTVIAQACALTPINAYEEALRWSPVFHHALAAAARILGREAPR